MQSRFRSSLLVMGLMLGIGIGTPRVSAQDAAGTFETIRSRSSCSDSDKRRIHDWLRVQIAQAPQLASANPEWLAVLRGGVRSEFGHAQCSPEFKQEFATQAGALATATLADKTTDMHAAWALALILRDLDSPQTIDAFLAGLKSPHAVVRFHCVEGLRDQRGAWSADAALLAKVVAALVSVGQADAAAEPVVVSHVYLVLSIPTQIDAVFKAFMDLFDARWALRVDPNVKADGAETQAYLFFVSNGGLLNGLSAERKQELVQRVAIFLVLDTRRFGREELGYSERDILFRMLVSEEEILLALVPGQQSVIEDAIKTQGIAATAAITKQVEVWVGDPESGTAGVLNAAPWNVPLGGIPGGDSPGAGDPASANP